MLRRRPPNAYSLLEVVLASSICAGALVPALALLRDGMSLAEKVDRRHLLHVFGVSMMEQQLAIVAASWTTGAATGNFAADGHSSIRYTVSRSDAAGSGGISGRLMSITVTTYSDDNGNNSLDASEMRTTFTTKIGKFVSYENKASS